MYVCVCVRACVFVSARLYFCVCMYCVCVCVCACVCVCDCLFHMYTHVFTVHRLRLDPERVGVVHACHGYPEVDLASLVEVPVQGCALVQ